MVLPRLPSTPAGHPGCTPSRSAFFRCGIRIDDRDGPAFPLPDHGSCFAPALILGPDEPRMVQDAPDGVGAEPGQAMGRMTECSLQHGEGPARRPISLPIRLPTRLLQNPLLLGLGVALGLSTAVTLHQCIHPVLVESGHK